MTLRSRSSTRTVKTRNGTLYQHGDRNRMSAAITGKTSKRKVTEPRTNWKRLRSSTDKQIRAGLRSDPDVHPTDEAFWAKAKVVMPRSKKTVTMRSEEHTSELQS